MNNPKDKIEAKLREAPMAMVPNGAVRVAIECHAEAIRLLLDMVSRERDMRIDTIALHREELDEHKMRLAALEKTSEASLKATRVPERAPDYEGMGLGEPAPTSAAPDFEAMGIELADTARKMVPSAFARFAADWLAANAHRLQAPAVERDEAWWYSRALDVMGHATKQLPWDERVRLTTELLRRTFTAPPAFDVEEIVAAIRAMMKGEYGQDHSWGDGIRSVLRERGGR